MGPSSAPATATEATSAALVCVDRLCFRAAGRDILHGIDLRIEEGSFLGILGPNGCGKTTLLRCIAGLRRPTRGTVRLCGRDVATVSPGARARMLALQAQDHVSALGYRVRDVVAMGRLAHRRVLHSDDAEDAKIIERWLAALDLLQLADRTIETLSGGERQRVVLARALAQEPSVLLLDEPTNHLDIRHRFAVLDAVRALGVTVIAVLHEIELAARVCDRIILMHDGHIVADGTPATALTRPNIERVYGVRASIDQHPTTSQIRIDLQPAPLAPSA